MSRISSTRTQEEESEAWRTDYRVYLRLRIFLIIDRLNIFFEFSVIFNTCQLEVTKELWKSKKPPEKSVPINN